MEYRLLGALEVVSNGTRVELGPPKQRALFAVLLLHAGEVVSTDHLIEQVWGDHPPRTAAHSVQLYISALRRSLEPFGEEAPIETRAPGYLLRVEAEYIDLRRFERLVAEGGLASSGGDLAEAVSRLEEALGSVAGVTARRVRLRRVRAGGNPPTGRAPPPRDRGARRCHARAGEDPGRAHHDRCGACARSAP